MIKGLTVDGAVDGIKYLLTPDFSQLGNIQIWRMGIAQIIFSTSCGMGGNILLSAYRKKSDEVVKSVAVIVSSNSIASLLGSLALFSYVG